MSRRKQAKPQHVQSNGRCAEECIDDGDHTSLETSSENVPGPFVCDRCCEEFSTLLDLKHHERFCYSHPQVLVFKERRTREPTNDYPVHCMSTNTVRELGEFVNTFEMEHDGIPQGSPGRTEDNMAFENCSRCISSNGSSHASTGEQQQAHIPLSPSALAPSLPQSGSSLPPENCSWRNTTSVTFENLQSTKVAVAQFSQQTQEDDCHIGTNMRDVSSLLEQILALQVQQIHQLQLTNQICHQVLLFASEKVKIPESPISCDQEPSSPKSTAALIDLCQNLSQQLAVAARTAQSLASANMTELEKCISTQQQSLGSESLLFHSESIQSLRKLVTLSFQKQFSKAEYAHPGSPNAQCNDLTCTKESSLAFGKNCLVNKTSNSLHFTQSTSQLQINCSPVMNCAASLAEPKNHKSMNMTLSGPKAPSNNGFFKHRCRFCPKLFGSESALQIHVRSHTGERPYKCNICGNRFSTRGNLKVHFQRHKKCHPHIQMNPYPIPQHLDEIPTSTGIPFGMSMLPENSTRWIDIKPCPDDMSTSSWIQSLGSTKQPSLIKEEGSAFLPSSSCSRNMVHVASNVKTEMSTDSPETAQGNGITTNCNNDEQTSLNLTFEVTTSPQEESKDHVSNDISSRCTHPNSAMAIPLSITSDTSKSQLLLDHIDKKVSDSSECIICRRLLRCPGAPRTQVTGPYLCALCRRAFSSKGNLRNHPAIHRMASTRRVQHSCPICQKEFTDALMLQQHVHLHTDGKTYAAPPCDQNISRPMGFNGGPLNKQHDTCASLDFSVDGGSSNFKSSSSSSLSSSVSDVSHCVDQSITSYGLSQRNWIKEEGEQNPTEKRYPACNFPTFGNLCPNSKPLCHFNSEVPFRTNVSLTTVKLIESCVNPSEIELFNRIKGSPISSPTLCEKGMFKNTACDICGKTFACQSALDIHYRTHTKERPFVCATCDRRFSTKGNLKQHTLTHQLRVELPSDMFEPSSPNKTPTAGPFPRTQLFKRVGDALPHSQATSGNQREGVSPVLSWSSADASSSLWSAAPAPRAAKQHRCGTCGKTFSSSSALQIHNRTHTGEKPFACTVCLRAFTTKGNLKVHMGTHMWNCAPNRKGRRLFTNGSAVPIASSPVILPALPQNNPVSTPKLGDSVYSK